MATMRPELSDAQLETLSFTKKTRAEIKFYCACKEQLAQRVVVHYSVHLLNDRMNEGEADFVIFDPKRGMLVVEIKGGGVAFDPETGSWTSIDADNNKYAIKDPFVQASSRYHDLRRMLGESERFKTHVKGRLTGGYAVFFPALTNEQVGRIKRPDTRREIMGSIDDLERIAEWVRLAFEAWAHPQDAILGDQGVRIAESLLCCPIDVRPLLSSKLRDQEELRIRLTQEQALRLEILEEHPRIAISGGAGTGKTLLAMARAERLAKNGQRVLFLCYNRALADHLKDVAGTGTHIHPFQFHQFCEWWVGVVSTKHGRNLLEEADNEFPGQNRISVQLPCALTFAVMEFDAPPYDAIIIDEGQDFSDADWEAVKYLCDATNAAICIFYDHNQKLYQRSGKFPITDEQNIFQLKQNCRNTKPIHCACYRFYQGPQTREPQIEGKPIDCIVAATREEQAKCIGENIRSLLAEEVPPTDIAVLVLGADGKNREYFAALSRQPLLSGLSWAEQTHRQNGTVLVDTVSRFKGLERSIVFLWLGNDVDMRIHRELLYVGMSRAKSCLFLIGTEQACHATLSGIR